MKQLIDDHGWKHIETYEFANRPQFLRERMRERCGAVPDVVLFWEAFHVASAAFFQLFNADFRVAVYCEDVHWFDEWTKSIKFLALSASDIILASYAPVLDRFFPEVAAKKRVVWVPHAASPEFMLPLNDQAENAVLLSGKINDFYPLRQRLKALADKTELNIIEQPHPGYQCNHNHQASDAVGAGYARQIHRCRAAFTDASRLHYVLAKYFEIPATGSLLLGDAAVEKELSELGFRQWEHYVPVSDQTLERELRHILDATNHENLDDVRRNGQTLVWERHKTSDRAKLINDICTAP